VLGGLGKWLRVKSVILYIIYYNKEK